MCVMLTLTLTLALTLTLTLTRRRHRRLVNVLHGLRLGRCDALAVEGTAGPRAGDPQPK